MDTKVKCNGCGIEFTTRATVPSITVEICSKCHPFYTGKQKLVDTAGRVEKFKARKLQAEKLKSKGVKAEAKPDDAVIEEIAEEIKEETVELAPEQDPAKDQTES